MWTGTPSWTLLLGRLFLLILVAVAVPVFTYLLASGADDEASRAAFIKGGWVLAMVADATIAAWFLTGLIRLRSTQYTVTNQRVLIESGVLTKTVNEIDMRLIDDSTFFQSVIHRMLGIGNVTIMSTDKNTPVYVMRGIPDPRGVRELVRTHSYHASQRQVFTRST